MTKSNDDFVLRIDAIVEQFCREAREGRCPDIDAYCLQNQELADELRPALSAAILLDAAKPNSVASNSVAHLSIEPKPMATGVTATLATAANAKPHFKFPFLRWVSGSAITVWSAKRVGAGMGIVFETIQESLGRRVALKILPRNAMHSHSQLERFQRDAITGVRGARIMSRSMCAA